MSYDLSLSDLPASARMIAEVIGIDATVTLCRKFFRGSRFYFYVPAVENLTPEHEVAQAIGIELARRLSAHFASEGIYIPSPYFLKRAAIWRDFMSEIPISEIAAKYRLTERRVCQITSEERNFDRCEHARRIGSKRTPAKAATARRYGTLGGNKNIMLKQIMSAFRSKPSTPYGSLFATIEAFNPKLTLLLAEDQAKEITIDRAIELMVPCLPAEMTVRYGDSASLMILKPAKSAQRSDPLMVRVETPLTAKSMSQNSVVISMLEALAVSAVIDKMRGPAELAAKTEERN